MVTPVSPLGQLIEDVRADFKDRHGVALSYQAIARRGGNVIGRTRVEQLAHNPIKQAPKERTLRALAKGLQVPYRVVLEKALESAGHDVSLLSRPQRPDEEATG